MKRISTADGRVHFRRDADHALCGVELGVGETDLFGNAVTDPVRETADAVTCPQCAELYCRIKNAPWGEVAADVLHAACYEAVKS